MHTKRQIQHLLASAGASPNKQLGQHFLIDLNLMRLLVDSANITDSDIVLEVGCGTGSLTGALAGCAGTVIAVELDRTLAEIAKGQLANAGNVKLINADVLRNKHTISPAVTDALALAREKYAGRILLVANLPYNVSAAVMLNLVTGPLRRKASCGVADAMYVTVQKEVADRMTAAPGGGDYGTLSIFLAATGDVKKIRVLKPTVFWPQPQVDSAMVGFVHKKEKSSQIQNMSLFNEMVSLFMNHRRKMLKSCTKFARGRLAEISDWPAIFGQCSIDPTLRPAQLAPEDYIAIANLCFKNPSNT